MSRAGAPRVLWVTPEVPDRGGGGGNIRQSYLLEALARETSADLLVAGGPPDAAVAAVVRRVVQVPWSTREVPAVKLVRRARDVRDAIAPGGPAERRDAAAMRRRLGEALSARDRYDVVCVEHAALADLIVERRSGERWVLALHNVASLTAQQTLPLVRGRRRWLWQREYAAARRLEARAVREFDLVTVTSDDDAAALPGSSVVVPNGVDIERFAYSALPAQPYLLFTGSLNFRPNIEGLQWFCTAVLPLLRTLRPDVRITVAGRHAAPSLERMLQESGVELVTNPPDVVPLLRRARAVFVPLHAGSGTRLKVLEAMAAGRPVVGTAVGVAGLHLVDGEHALIRDRPAEFAQALAEVLGADRAATELVRNARRHVEQRFSWGRIAHDYLATMTDLVETQPARD